MNKSKKWKRRQLKKQDELLEQDSKSQMEKDIWHLKWIQANIGYKSMCYRYGYYSSLGRIIEFLESQKP